jgi:hypothetical protein
MPWVDPALLTALVTLGVIDPWHGKARNDFRQRGRHSRVVSL